jgi:hypothetical protein
MSSRSSIGRYRRKQNSVLAIADDHSGCDAGIHLLGAIRRRDFPDRIRRWYKCESAEMAATPEKGLIR